MEFLYECTCCEEMFEEDEMNFFCDDCIEAGEEDGMVECAGCACC
jgi:hypothetical protein